MDQFDSATDNELEILSEINHDNIVRYFDHFHLDKQTYLITEYCEVSSYSITNNYLYNNLRSKRFRTAI